MADILLTSDVFEVKEILKKTRANMYKDIEVGDLIQLSVYAKAVGGNRGGSYAVPICVSNLTQGSHTHNTFNRLNTLKHFRLEKVGEHFE